jgi:hypothetical protein
MYEERRPFARRRSKETILLLVGLCYSIAAPQCGPSRWRLSFVDTPDTLTLTGPEEHAEMRMVVATSEAAPQPGGVLESGLELDLWAQFGSFGEPPELQMRSSISPRSGGIFTFRYRGTVGATG